MEELEYYDRAALEYIYDNYNKHALFKMNDEELKDIVYRTCDELSWANEELEFGTYGQNFACDVDIQKVYEYIKRERDDFNVTHQF